MRRSFTRLPNQPNKSRKNAGSADQKKVHRETAAGVLCGKRSYYQTTDPAAVECDDCKALQEGRDKPSVVARKAYDAAREAAARPDGAHEWRPINQAPGWMCEACEVKPTDRPAGMGIIAWLQSIAPCAGKKAAG